MWHVGQARDAAEGIQVERVGRLEWRPSPPPTTFPFQPGRRAPMRIPQAGLIVTILGTMALCLPVLADGSAGKVTTVAVPGGKPVVARTDKEGAVHILLESEGGPKYAKSTDGGV